VAATIDGLEPPRIDLNQLGVDERRWGPVLGALRGTAITDLARGAGADRLVVVAPHPDDETLGVGGSVATFADAGGDVLVVSVTDGEAAPVESSDLAAVRRRELRVAVGCLAPAARIERLGLPDGGLADRHDELTERLTRLLTGRDLVLAPYADDGHPDHDACGRAALAASTRTGASCWTYPVWAWHWHDPDVSAIGSLGVRIELSVESARRKAAAISCYRSQLEHEPPVVPRAAMARYRRSFEVLMPT
jgi:LmbE family N-acetylglucosaminyl deacetylase